MTRWQDQPRDEEGQWIDDGIPNKEQNMAVKKKTDPETTPETDTESTGASSETSSDETTTPDGHVQGAEPQEAPVDEDSQKTAASGYTDHGTTTGLGDGDAFPDKPEYIASEGQTRTETSTLNGSEYEVPKFRAVKDETRGVIGISLYNWVGPEALTVTLQDVDDFKAFVASL